MTAEFFKRAMLFVVFCLVQALVLNQIHLLGYATPLLYVYFVILFRRNHAKWSILLWCFTLGLVLDTFTNTPGVAAGALTLLGVVQPYLLQPFVPRDSVDDLQPSMRTLGMSKFIAYSAACVVLYVVVFFTLEVFNFLNWQQWLFSVGGSAALTLVLILAIDYFRSTE